MVRVMFALWLCLASGNALAGAQSQTRMGSGEGAVFFHQAINYPIAGALGSGGGLYVSVERVDGSKRALFYIESKGEGFQSSRAYAGSLPAGSYRFVDFLATKCSFICGKPYFPAPTDMPGFEIRAGEVSYLGTIFFSRMRDLYSKSDEFTTDWAWKETPDLQEGRRLLAGSFPNLASATTTLHAGWQPAIASDVAERLLKIRSHSAGMYLSSRFGSDGFYFGSQNGVVKRWHPGSAIELLDVGTDFMINSIVETAGRAIVVAGEGGTLRVSIDDGKTWVDRFGTLPFGVVGNLLPLDDDEVAFTVSLPDSVAVYRGQAVSGQWRKIGEFQLKFAVWTGLPGVMAQMFRHQSRLILTLPSRKFAVIDLDTNTSEILEPPGSIANFKVSPDGTLWCTCAKILAFSPYESHDFGKTWISSNISRFMVLPEFYDSQRAFSYQGAIVSKEKTGISITNDGGKTWQFKHNPDLNMAWWLPAYSADGSIMLLNSLQVFGTSMMQLSMYSSDGGRTWTTVPQVSKWKIPPG